MKFNIKKLGSGGGFAVFTPMLIGENAPIAPPSSNEGEKKESLLDDDLYKKLVGEGLVNDVNAFVKELSKVEASPLAYLQTGNRSKTLQLVGKINEIMTNKKN